MSIFVYSGTGDGSSFQKTQGDGPFVFETQGDGPFVFGGTVTNIGKWSETTEKMRRNLIFQ